MKSKIGDSVEKDCSGVTQVSEAGATMQEIVTSIRSVTGIMGSITLASQQQSSGIEHINQAITQMDRVTARLANG